MGIIRDYSYSYCSRHVPIRWKPLRCNCNDYGNDRENNNFYNIWQHGGIGRYNVSKSENALSAIVIRPFSFSI